MTKTQATSSKKDDTDSATIVADTSLPHPFGTCTPFAACTCVETETPRDNPTDD